MKIFGGKSRRGGQKRKTARKSGSWVYPLFIALFSLGAVALIIAALINSFVKPPELRPTLPPLDTEDYPVEESDLVNPPTPRSQDDPLQEVGALRTEEGRKEGVFTFILAGVDADDYHTDTLMVARLDVENKKLNVVSIPRDLMVNVKRSNKKINAAYGMGNSKREGQGVLQLKEELTTVIGFQPDFHAIVNIEAFRKIIDAMDGVEFDVPQRMKYSDPPENLYIDLQPGLQILDGDKAEQLVRFRRYKEGDIERVKVQQDFLKAVAKQMLSVKNVFKVGDFAKILMENMDTNLETGNLVWLGTQLLGLDMEDIHFETLPNFSGNYNALSYVYVRETDAIELINEMINPQISPVTAADLDILILQNDVKSTGG